MSASHSVNAKSDKSNVILIYLRLILLKYNEDHNKKIYDTFDHNFTNFPG